MELPVQENVAPGAAGHVRENFRGPAPQLRGEAVLQGGGMTAAAINIGFT